MFISTPIPRTSAPKSNYMTLNHFKGIDKSKDPTQIDDLRSPDMGDCELDTEFNVRKRPGFKRIFQTPIEGTKVFYAGFSQLANKFIMATNSRLYTCTEGNAPVEIYNGIANARMKSFYLNSKQYFINGSEYLQYDGNTVVTVESIAYIPTTVIGRSPTGGGTIFEAVNLLQPKRKNSFVGNGSATTFQLDTTNLDAATVTAVVAGVTMTEGSGFTVNRTTGQVTFTTAPGNGSGIDNVIITFAKTVSGYADRIKKCRYFAIYGYNNDTRIFLTGNPDYKNQDWQSGLYDPTYFPDTGYTKLGSDYTAIKGYSKAFRTLQVLKEESDLDSTIYNRNASISANGVISFPVEQGNARKGCIASESIQIIDDNPVFLSSRGLYRIEGNNVKDERNVTWISDNIEPDLLNEQNLQNAESADFDGKYWLAVNNRIYILDYKQRFTTNDGRVIYEGYIYNNIPASCFFEYNGYLYFGSNTTGMIYKFKKHSDPAPYNDDDQPIDAYWFSKVFAMNAPNFRKLVETIQVDLVPNSTRTSFDVYIITDKTSANTAKLVLDGKTKSRVVFWDFDDFNFDDASFVASTLPQQQTKKVKAKKIIYFQLLIKNNRLDEGMSFNNIITKYLYQSENK